MERSSFDAHAVWPALSELESLLDGAEDQADPAATAPLSALRYVAAAIRSHADPSDSGPYTNVGLVSVQNALSSVTQEVRNYISNANVAHLTNAQTNSDQVLYHVGLWPTGVLKGGAAVQANKVFTEYRDAAEATLKTLRETNEGLLTRLTQQTAESEAALAALTAQITTLTAKITQDETRLDAALTTNNDAFTKKQTERDEKFSSWLEEQGKALQHLASKDLKAIQDHRASADEALEAIDQLRDDTQTVAGLAAGDQVARGYKRYSLRQWVAGLISYGVGFAFLATGVVLVIRTIRGIEPGDEISWQFTLLKLGLTASAVFAAVIAFRLGSHLLAEASTAKRFELELKALGPLFPHDTEQDTLKAVKKDLIERSFGQGWSTNEKSKEVMNEKVLERIVEAVARGAVRPPGS